MEGFGGIDSIEESRRLNFSDDSKPLVSAPQATASTLRHTLATG